MTSLILAIVIGGAFGAVLDRVGATSPDWIGKMLNLTNLSLMKAIILAIGTGSGESRCADAARQAIS